MFDMLEHNKALQELDLSGLCFSLFIISDVLMSTVNTFLVHTGSDIGCSEIAVLVNALEANTSLRELELEGYLFRSLFFIALI